MWIHTHTYATSNLNSIYILNCKERARVFYDSNTYRHWKGTLRKKTQYSPDANKINKQQKMFEKYYSCEWCLYKILTSSSWSSSPRSTSFCLFFVFVFFFLFCFVLFCFLLLFFLFFFFFLLYFSFIVVIMHNILRSVQKSTYILMILWQR